MYICENCGKEHNGSYGSGRFCSKECAKSFSTKSDNKVSLKLGNCIDCGKEIYVNKRASLLTCRCRDCYETYMLNSNLSRVKTCKICGAKYISSKGCKNKFCISHNIKGFDLLVKYFGFDSSKLGTSDVENEFNRVREVLFNLYWIDNLSAKEIADKFNFKSKHSILQTVFKFLDIPNRNLSECISNAYFTGKLSPVSNTQFKPCFHTSWNGNSVYLRSSYELDYALELDKTCINYEVESLRIKYFNSSCNQECVAIPDFYLPDTNTIVEIKSNWTLDVQEMKDKAKVYKELGYNFKLILEHKEEDLYSLSEEKIHPNKEFSIYRILGSAYGTCWIHNNKESKKIKLEDLHTYLDDGWVKGRKMKFDI